MDPGKSPFVTMFAMTGLGIAASVVNLVVLTSAASSANSGIYSTSRMLYGLSLRDDAPKSFAKLSKHSVPLNALFLSCVFLLSAIVLLAAGNSIIGAFTLVTSMSATLFMAVWTIITVAYLLYLGRRPELHAASRFKLPGGAFSAWVVIAFMAIMCVILSLERETLLGLVASGVWLVAITVAAVVHRHRLLTRAGTTPVTTTHP